MFSIISLNHNSMTLEEKQKIIKKSIRYDNYGKDLFVVVLYAILSLCIIAFLYIYCNI